MQEQADIERRITEDTQLMHLQQPRLAFPIEVLYRGSVTTSTNGFGYEAYEIDGGVVVAQLCMR